MYCRAFALNQGIILHSMATKLGHGFSVKVELRPWPEFHFDTVAMATVSKWSCSHGHNSTLTLRPWPQCQSGVLAMASVSK